jgi:hypothetical protein
VLPSLTHTRWKLEWPSWLNLCDAIPVDPAAKWCFLGEVVANESLFRPMARVRDRDGKTVLVAVYASPPAAAFDARKFVVGHTVALIRARPQQFADGQIGFRVEDPAQLSVRSLF